MRPYPYPAFASSTHAFNSIFESCNHTPFADPERIFLILLNGIAAIQEQAVLNLYGAPAVGNGPISDYQVFILDAAPSPVHAKLPNVRVLPRRMRGVAS
jgi:hypothetical protein